MINQYLIESLDVPHSEVALIVAYGVTVDRHYLVDPGDRIVVLLGGGCCAVDL
ncbi:hypothetical protein [Marinimicrobium agarilyticum]|uniref:hypothetical protein n=1 Tax=Marinimicrobium agarilyticum TaxID=306546 RepID=UPI00042909B4|nr:hypothetical protein [Marinimicrobium agarilyticum]